MLSNLFDSKEVKIIKSAIKVKAKKIIIEWHPVEATNWLGKKIRVIKPYVTMEM